MIQEVKNPDRAAVESFVTPTLLDAAPYTIDEREVPDKLDQNESPWDWPHEAKERVTKRLLTTPWNRYPRAFAPSLSRLVAEYTGVGENNVLLGPGSDYLCSLVLRVFGKHAAGKVVAARPSFPLYENHCRYEGIPHEIWPLNDDLQYDISLFPKIPDRSLIIFASPNNPVGNVLPKRDLARLLREYKTSIFVADEAYFEYSHEPYTELLKDFSNLIIIRTFSKTLGSAGIRLGYFVASPVYLRLMHKLCLPYLLNHFAIIAAEELLDSPESRDYLKTVVANAISERQRLFQTLSELGPRLNLRVIPSQANFVLCRWQNPDQATDAYKTLIAHGILVRDVSKGPGLAGCLRISLGTHEQNNKLLQIFSENL